MKNCKVNRNSEKNGIEIKFADKPSSEIREQMKSRRFRYSSRQNIWYKKFSQIDYDFAVKLCGNSGTVTGYEPKKEDAPIEVRSYTLADVNAKNFTYCGLHFRTTDLTPEQQDAWSIASLRDISSDKIIVMSPYKGDAERIVRKYLKDHYPEFADKVGINTYPKKYIREARKLFKAGAYLPKADNPEKSFPVYSIVYPRFKKILEEGPAGKVLYSKGTSLYVKNNFSGLPPETEIILTEDSLESNKSHVWGKPANTPDAEPKRYRLDYLQKEFPALRLSRYTNLYLLSEYRTLKPGQLLRLEKDYRAGAKSLDVSYTSNLNSWMTKIVHLNISPDFVSDEKGGKPISTRYGKKEEDAKTVTAKPKPAPKPIPVAEVISDENNEVAEVAELTLFGADEIGEPLRLPSVLDKIFRNAEQYWEVEAEGGWDAVCRLITEDLTAAKEKLERQITLIRESYAGSNWKKSQRIIKQLNDYIKLTETTRSVLETIEIAFCKDSAELMAARMKKETKLTKKIFKDVLCVGTEDDGSEDLGKFDYYFPVPISKEIKQEDLTSIILPEEVYIDTKTRVDIASGKAKQFYYFTNDEIGAAYKVDETNLLITSDFAFGLIAAMREDNFSNYAVFENGKIIRKGVIDVSEGAYGVFDFMFPKLREEFEHLFDERKLYQKEAISARRPVIERRKSEMKDDAPKIKPQVRKAVAAPPVKKKAANETLAQSAKPAAQNKRVETTDTPLNAVTIFGGGYFRYYPEKILGTVRTENPNTGRTLTDAFGKPRAEVWGTVADVEKGIDAPAVKRFNHFIADNQLTVLTEKNEAETVKKIKQSLSKTRKRKALKVKKRGKCGAELECLNDTIVKYNTNIKYKDDDGAERTYSISQDEMKVWVTYQVNRGIYDLNKVKTNEWSQFFVPKPDYADWYDKGLVAYTGQEYQPVSVYYAGNIYRKLELLNSAADRVIAVIGEEGLEKQREGLEKVKPQVLVLESDVNNRLYLNPFHKIWYHDDVKFDETIQGQGIEPWEESRLFIHVLFEKWIKTLNDADFEVDGTKSNAANIKNYWIKKVNFPREKYSKSEKAVIKRNAAVVGRELFDKFCTDAIPRDKRNVIANLWNSQNNNYRDIAYHRIPVGFDISKTFKGGELIVRPAQREGVAFMANRGTGVLAYDVGVGKTMTAILAMADAFQKGMFSRPLVVVPNKVYHKWIGEIRGVYAKKDIYQDGKLLHKKGALIAEGILPNVEVNDYYNLGTGHIHKAVDDNGIALTVNEYSVTVISFEGLEKIGFSEETETPLVERMKLMLSQAQGGRGVATDVQKAKGLIDKALNKTVVEIEDFGFDAIIVDEAHNFRNLFMSIPGDVDKDGKRQKSNYKSGGGQPSTRAVKLFMLNIYIQSQNRNRNTFGLTATPFNNRATEIFSLLAHFDYNGMVDFGIQNIAQFCDNYIDQSTEDVWTATGEYETKAVIRGYNNLPSLQAMVFRSINYKTGEDANIVRPDKVVLPLYNDDKGLPLDIELTADTKLPPSPLQHKWIEEIQDFINYRRQPGKASAFADRHAEEHGALKSRLFDFYFLDSTKTREIDLDDKTVIKQNIVVGDYLIALGAMRTLTFSPYALAFDGVKMYDKDKISPAQFINDSPKLKYICECIRSVRDYHVKQGTPVSGQIIYADVGTEWFGHIKRYLVDSVGYAEDEVEVFFARRNGVGATAKKREQIKDDFQDNKVKVIIGSSTLREGVDLQNHCSVIYPAYLDWNPTDNHQLWGRGWRFGNKHLFIRICIALLENSSDVFTWQKLSEKMSRLNSIWTRGNKSKVFEEKELNAEELKRSLITDTGALVQFEVEEQARKVMADYIVVTKNIDLLKEGIGMQKEFAQLDARINTFLSRAKMTFPNAIIDETDIKAVYRLVKRYALRTENSSQRFTIKSAIDTHIKYARRLDRTERDVLQQYKLSIFDDYTPVIEKLQVEKEAIEAKVKAVRGSANVEKIRLRIEAEKAREAANRKPVGERVNEFARLNYLLDCFRGTHACDIYGRAENVRTKKAVTKAVQKKVELKIDERPSKPKVLRVPSALADFLPVLQLATVRENLRGVDGQAYFDDEVTRLNKQVKSFPRLYGTEKYGRADKIVYGRFYYASTEIFVLEYKKKDGVLYCYTIRNGDVEMAELGYQSLDELRNMKKQFGGMQFDFYWTPKYLSEVLHNYDPDYYKKPEYTLSERIASGEETRDLSAFGMAAPAPVEAENKPAAQSSVKVTKAVANVQLKGLRTAMKYLKGETLKTAKQQERGLLIAIKYL